MSTRWPSGRITDMLSAARIVAREEAVLGYQDPLL